MATDAQLADLHKVWQYYHTYPGWIKNIKKQLSIRYFIDQIYAWALFISGKTIPRRIILEEGLKTKINIGQALSWLISAKTGIRLSRALSPIPRGEMISKIQRALH